MIWFVLFLVVTAFFVFIEVMSDTEFEAEEYVKILMEKFELQEKELARQEWIHRP